MEGQRLVPADEGSGHSQAEWMMAQLLCYSTGADQLARVLPQDGQPLFSVVPCWQAIDEHRQ
jgi:hypothetical protein